MVSGPHSKRDDHGWSFYRYARSYTMRRRSRRNASRLSEPAPRLRQHRPQRRRSQHHGKKREHPHQRHRAVGVVSKERLPDVRAGCLRCAPSAQQPSRSRRFRPHQWHFLHKQHVKTADAPDASAITSVYCRGNREAPTWMTSLQRQR